MPVSPKRLKDDPRILDDDKTMEWRRGHWPKGSNSQKATTDHSYQTTGTHARAIEKKEQS